MGKILIIARREYRAIVGTKAFLIALTIMPILMFGGIAVQNYLKGKVGPSLKRIVVLDGTGELMDDLLKAAEDHNKHEIFDLGTDKQIKPRYELQPGPAGPVTEQVRLELSDRIRGRQLDAFVEIPPDVLKMPGDGGTSNASYYAENAAVSDERGWVEGVLGNLVRTRRLREVGLDPKVVQRASAPVFVNGLGLVTRSHTGEIQKALQADIQATIFVPFGMMMLMWMVIFLAAQPMLESVLEEKSQRIAEVLLGSANATELMVGKLLGGVGGSLTVVAVYGMGAWAVLQYYDLTHLIGLRVVPWFLIYQVLAVLLFGSVFMAVGAAVNHLKEAQGMLLPVWLVMMVPLFVWIQIVREPTGGFATALSFIPPFAPLAMVLRVGASSSVPLWQPALGVVPMLAATLLVVWAAGRIFRIGILAQGRSPKVSELLRWVAQG